jgi:hypothetical protein
VVINNLVCFHFLDGPTIYRYLGHQVNVMPNNRALERRLVKYEPKYLIWNFVLLGSQVFVAEK